MTAPEPKPGLLADLTERMERVERVLEKIGYGDEVYPPIDPERRLVNHGSLGRDYDAVDPAPRPESEVETPVTEMMRALTQRNPTTVAAIRADERRKLTGEWQANYETSERAAHEKLKTEYFEMRKRLTIEGNDLRTKLEAAERYHERAEKQFEELHEIERQFDAVKSVLISSDEDYGADGVTVADIVERILCQRDTAIRERDEARAMVKQCAKTRAEYQEERDAAKAKLAAADELASRWSARCDYGAGELCKLTHDHAQELHAVLRAFDATASVSSSDPQSSDKSRG